MNRRSDEQSFLASGSQQWTTSLPKTDHVHLFLNTDWEATTLGPLASWGPALRFATTMVFADSRPACVYWGPERTALYNEPFIVLASGTHPALMGSPFRVAFPELVDSISGMLDQAEITGEAIEVNNVQLFTERERRGLLEETYFVGSFIPLRGDDGKVAGFYNSLHESTEQVCLERWRQITNAIALTPNSPLAETLLSVLDAMRSNPHDICLAMLYSFNESPIPGRLELEGTIGIPDGHMRASKVIDLRDINSCWEKVLREVTSSRKSLILEYTDSRLSDEYGHVFEGVQWTGFGEPSRNIVFSPLCDTAGRLRGIMVHGTNPRRPFNDDVLLSAAGMICQVEAKWQASISYEEAKLRELELLNQLTDSERRLREMAHAAPYGMMLIGPDGRFEWINDIAYDITGHPRSNPNPTIEEWNRVYVEKDRHISADAFANVLDGDSRATIEMRLTRMWQPPIDGAAPVNAWVLATGWAAVKDGKVKHIMAWVTEISRQKWAESVQTRNAEAALLAKRQQEKYIDTTSHEMRNPLMAMMQLADGILRSLEGLDEAQLDLEDYRSLVHSNVESATTIVACAMHQMCIIDDVLVLSKLESQMLSITPGPQRPDDVVESTLRMFSAELIANDINLNTIKDPSLDALQIDHVLCDRLRLVQVLINLLSNAFKFTAIQEVRTIDFAYGAQRCLPQIPTTFGNIKWLATKEQSPPRPFALPSAEAIYLYFIVQDTGPGFISEEIERMFKRFSQASSKTHVTYGGSGLGLYICRELAEKQGGQVGLASESGRGAAFGFYIETCRSEPPRKASALAALGARMTNGIAKSQPQKLGFRPRISGRGLRVDSTQKESDPTQALSRRLQPRHVMLVEDNLINQKVLSKQLVKAGCNVTVANHGAEALELLEQTDCWWKPEDYAALDTDAAQPIDVVLLDWEMPVMNGLECIKKIRELQQSGHITRHLLVLAITANTRDEQVNQAMVAGMDDVMPKPFTVAELLDRMSRVVAARTTAGVER